MRGSAVSVGTDKKVFVECFAETKDGPCYQALGITNDLSVSDKDAARRAVARGWKVAGYRGAKQTRCPAHRGVRKSTDAQELVRTTGRARP